MMIDTEPGHDFGAMEAHRWAELDTMGSDELDELEHEVQEQRHQLTRLVRNPYNFGQPTPVADIDNPMHQLLCRAGDAIRQRRCRIIAEQEEHRREQEMRRVNITAAANRVRDAIKLCGQVLAVERDDQDVPEPVPMPDATTMDDETIDQTLLELRAETMDVEERVSRLNEDADLLRVLPDAGAKAIARELKSDAAALAPRLESLNAATRAMEDEAQARAEVAEAYRDLLSGVGALRGASAEAIAVLRAHVAALADGGQDKDGTDA